MSHQIVDQLPARLLNRLISLMCWRPDGRKSCQCSECCSVYLLLYLSTQMLSKCRIMGREGTAKRSGWQGRMWGKARSKCPYTQTNDNVMSETGGVVIWGHRHQVARLVHYSRALLLPCSLVTHIRRPWGLRKCACASNCIPTVAAALYRVAGNGSIFVVVVEPAADHHRLVLLEGVACKRLPKDCLVARVTHWRRRFSAMMPHWLEKGEGFHRSFHSHCVIRLAHWPRFSPVRNCRINQKEMC